ncbi:hypothetical protein SUGI_0601720 [Cryptomeria japonica]|nr:hypothetical protein SUGI_0601720 [Cryptomeria japonica]
MSESGLYNPGMSTWIEAYNTAERTWQRVVEIPGLEEDQILKGFGMVSIGKALFVAGGRVCRKNLCDTMPSPPSEIDIRVSNELYKLDCVTNTWTRCADLNTARVDFACSVYDGKIYVAGGRSQTTCAKGVSSAEVYDPELDTWTLLPSMSTGRYKSVGVTWEGKIYIVGGFAGPEDSEQMILPYTNYRSSVEVFDPAEGRWSLIPGMWQLDVPPNQIVTVNERLYSSGDCLTMWKGHIEAYDSKLNMWKIVEGSHLRTMQNPAVLGNLSPDNGRGEQLYVTMAAVGSRLFFLGGHRLPDDYTRYLQPLLCCEDVRPE